MQLTFNWPIASMFVAVEGLLGKATFVAAGVLMVQVAGMVRVTSKVVLAFCAAAGRARHEVAKAARHNNAPW